MLRDSPSLKNWLKQSSLTEKAEGHRLVIHVLHSRISGPANTTILPVSARRKSRDKE
uniref:Uncharacterized protein n=1 Tax=Physcomitrium patens TaxID=3218 RepID=A0A2K1IS75_PHYPA|nr:hypothetical protein PHYPA_026233 [Physcomitrium patens]